MGRIGSLVLSGVISGCLTVASPGCFGRPAPSKDSVVSKCCIGIPKYYQPGDDAGNLQAWCRYYKSALEYESLRRAAPAGSTTFCPSSTALVSYIIEISPKWRILHTAISKSSSSKTLDRYALNLIMATGAYPSDVRPCPPLPKDSYNLIVTFFDFPSMKKAVLSVEPLPDPASQELSRTSSAYEKAEP